MHYRTRTRTTSLAIALILFLLSVPAVLAHQPFFEETDTSADMPWSVEDPTVSTALYFTLASADDVDYVTFQGQAGQPILIGLTIPQVEGHEDFAPTLAVMGPGLPDRALPATIDQPADTGALLIPPSTEPPTPFFEPFSRTSYWERQEQIVTLPADGTYTIAIWHPAGRLGRYVLVVGDKEVPGGDLAFPLKMRRYWQPVPQPAEDVVQPAAMPATGTSTASLWQRILQQLAMLTGGRSAK